VLVGGRGGERGAAGDMGGMSLKRVILTGVGCAQSGRCYWPTRERVWEGLFISMKLWGTVYGEAAGREEEGEGFSF